LTRSLLEERFLRLCAQAGIPRPQVNVTVEGLTVDFMWPLPRLIAETDGRRYHHHDRAFERDRLRDQRLLAAGWRVVRFTYRQVTREPGSVIAVLRNLMG
jgi:very-short-patch-repair endonuclease